MTHSIKLENIGCLITESHTGLEYKSDTSVLLKGDRIESIGSG